VTATMWMAVVVMVTMNMTMPKIKMKFEHEIWSSHDCEHPDRSLLGCETTQFSTNFPLEPAASISGEDYIENGGIRFLWNIGMYLPRHYILQSHDVKPHSPYPNAEIVDLPKSHIFNTNNHTCMTRNVMKPIIFFCLQIHSYCPSVTGF
jgi:hypothetical protein